MADQSQIWSDRPEFGEVYGLFQGDYDAEPDMFYFNAGGHSGSMYFDVLKNTDNWMPSLPSKHKKKW